MLDEAAERIDATRPAGHADDDATILIADVE
jgi:hypothetical protein